MRETVEALGFVPVRVSTTSPTRVMLTPPLNLSPLAASALAASSQSSLDFRSRLAYRSSDESWYPPFGLLLILTDQLGYQTPFLHTSQHTTHSRSIMDSRF